jgi:hypothetical protein
MGMSTLQQEALAEARRCIGIMEHGANNSGADVLRIITENGGNGPEAWCGDFVAHCYRVARRNLGKPPVKTRLWAAVRMLGRVPGTRFVKRPRGGDIVTFTFDHTGIVETYCDAMGHRANRRNATHLRTIEGNTGRSGAVSDSTTGGDGVYRKVRPLGLVAHYVRVDK